jgi:hypothetical protein
MGKLDVPTTGIIPALTTDAQIKRSFRRHLKTLGFKKDSAGLLMPVDCSKDGFRLLHQPQRIKRLAKERAFVKEKWNNLKSYFASGRDIDPAAIAPNLELIEAGTEQSDLFRLACLLWSVPVSAGYGRRMRFLVWDKSNNKLIGLLALGDPVFNLRVRDEWIGWNSQDRKERLVNVMDAYVLGAVPPYNMMLGAKLIASLAVTREVKDIFHHKYSATRGIISGQKKRAELCLVTTTSALGRSSVYNRLRLPGRTIFSSIGFTSGWGHFHIPDRLFSQMRAYLKSADDDYADNHQYGDGPNWRLRTARRTLQLVGMNPDLLRHGISREIFVAPVAENARDFLRGATQNADFSQTLTIEQTSDLALKRWIIPRAERLPDFQSWRADQIEAMLKTTPLCRPILPNKTLAQT